MTLTRFFLLVFAALVAVAAALILVALNSGVQTWVVRRLLAGRTEFRGSVDSVSIGFGRTRLEGLRVERNGIALTLPSLEADLPIFALLHHRAYVHRLRAKGWTLDFTGVSRNPVAAVVTPVRASSPAATSPLLAPAQVPDPPPAVSGVEPAAFQGIFDGLQLPLDLILDGVELEGDAILPPSSSSKGSAVRAHMTISGGGLEAGHPGRFRFTVAAMAASDSPVNSVSVDGTLTAMMRTPRTFSRLAVAANAAAQGPKLPQGARLSAEIDASKGNEGETYAATFSRENKELAKIQGGLVAATRRFAGTWKLDISDGDVTPFALGRALPSFEVKGGGRFGTGATLAETQLSGGLNMKADHLNVIRPEFGAVGEVEMAADFDVTGREGLVRVDQLQATVSSSKPVLVVRGLQSFAFNTRTDELQVADATRDIFGIVLQNMPLEWLEPWMSGISLTGGPVSGEFVASARNRGLSFRSKSPLAVSGVSAARDSRPLLRNLDIVIGLSVDFAPQGWQAEISPCSVKDLMTFSAKCGRLSGAGQPIKATGQLTANLPLLLAQPGLASLLTPGRAPDSPPVLSRGDLACDFTASLDGKRAIEMKLSFANLVAAPGLTTESLPAISADIRADQTGDGKITFEFPLILTRGDRKSDLTLAGTLQSTADKRLLDGQITSTRLVLDDLKILGIPFAQPTAAGPAAPPTRAAAPLWAGVEGQLSVALKKVEFMTLAVDDVTGSFRLAPEFLRIETLHAGLSEGGDLKLDGGLTFTSAASEPYGLKAELAVTGFNPAVVFRALDPNQPPTVEGKFNVAAVISSSGLNPADLGTKIRGECHATSKGGVFRMLSTTVSSDVQTASKAAAIGSFLGSMASAVGGAVGKHANEFASAAQAVTEFVKAISPISYDQLSVEITRDASLNAVLKDFTLIAPELRLAGTGEMTYQANTPLLEQPLSMEFKLRARGHLADAMKYAGILEGQADELGYAACNFPLRVKGTLEKPDASEVRSALGNLAIQRGSSLLDKFFGK